MAASGNPICRDCGEPFSINIMRPGGLTRCGICLQVESIVKPDWDKDFLEKLNFRTGLE